MPLACSHSPQPSDIAGRPLRAAVRGQRVEVRVGRRVVGLTRRRRPDPPSTRTARTPRRRGRGSARAGSRPRRPWRAAPCRPAPGVSDVDDRVVDHTGGVDHRRQRARVVDARQHLGQRVAVGDVGGDHRDVGAGLGAVRRPARRRPGRRGHGATPAAGRGHRGWPTTWRATEAPAMPVPPVISTVPAAHASGIVNTTLPMWRAWLRCRSAAGARRTSHVVTGSGSQHARFAQRATRRTGSRDAVGARLEQVEGAVAHAGMGRRPRCRRRGCRSCPSPGTRRRAAAGAATRRRSRPASESSTTSTPRPPVTDAELLLEVAACASRRCGRRRSPWPATCPTCRGWRWRTPPAPSAWPAAPRPCRRRRWRRGSAPTDPAARRRVRAARSTRWRSRP